MNNMYSNKFVLSVICDGQIVKELDNGQVNVPFGSEYTLRLRNRNNRRAIAKISIDGENMSGGGIIVEANAFVDIERPVDVARKFKFVSLDSPEAQDYGKNGPNPGKTKGTVKVDFALEYQETRVICNAVRGYPYYPYEPQYGSYSWGKDSASGNYNDLNMKYGSVSCDLGTTKSVNLCDSNSLLRSRTTASVSSASLSEGATVEGGRSSQSFTYTNFRVDDTTWTTLRIFMMGFDPCEACLPTGKSNQYLTSDGEWATLLNEKEKLTQKLNKKKKDKIKKLQEEIENLKKELEEEA